MSVKEIVEKANYIEFYQSFVPTIKMWAERIASNKWNVTFIEDGLITGKGTVMQEKIIYLISEGLELFRYSIIGGFAADENNKIIKIW